MKNYMYQNLRFQAVTFEELVAYAREKGTPPNYWSFTFFGHNVSHENDKCYIVKPGVHFKDTDVLLIDKNNDLIPVPAEEFYQTAKEIK